LVVGVGRGAFQGQVVGVVRDTFDFALDAQPAMTVYRPMDSADAMVGSPFHYVVRFNPTRSDGRQLVQRTIERESSSTAVTRASTIWERLALTIQKETFVAFAALIFSTAAFAISLFGLAAVVMLTVVRRQREIAVRMAIGATTNAILGLVTREALTMGVLGISLGLLLGSLASHSVSSLLYQVQPVDPLTVGVASVASFVVVGLAAYIPAIRATRLDPAELLRSE
jgi:ABC-type lipoprotein release transport system permease subunit